MNNKLNLLEKCLLELDLSLAKLFAYRSFGSKYRKYSGVYTLSPTERNEIAVISQRLANPHQ